MYRHIIWIGFGGKIKLVAFVLRINKYVYVFQLFSYVFLYHAKMLFYNFYIN